jgi:hypothetical protein
LAESAAVAVVVKRKDEVVTLHLDLRRTRREVQHKDLTRRRLDLDGLPRPRPVHHHRLDGLADHRGRARSAALRSRRLGGLGYVDALLFVTAGEIVRHVFLRYDWAG